MMECSFKKTYDLKKRKSESSRIREKYTNKIPIIVTKDDKCTLGQISKSKYLVPEDITLGQFSLIIRKRIEIKESDALFFFINGSTIPPISNSMVSLYEDYKDDDGFMYMTYCGENVFGNSRN